MKDKNLATLFQNRAYRFGPRPLFSENRGAGRVWVTWQETAREVEELGRGLLASGVAPGERVAILSANRGYWVSADLAVASVGAVTVPLPPEAADDLLRDALRRSHTRLIFAETLPQAERILAFRGDLPDLGTIVVCEGESAADPFLLPLAEFRSRGAGIPASRFYESVEAVGPDDLSTILYPEGAELTHARVLSDSLAAVSRYAVGNDDLSLSLLPLSHPFGRAEGLFAFLSVGARVAFGSDGGIPGDLPEVRPTLLVTVPEALERFFRGIREGVDRRSRPVRQLFDVTNEGKNGPLLKPFYETIFARKIRRSLGGNLRRVILADRSVDPGAAAFLKTLGIESIPPP